MGIALSILCKTKIWNPAVVCLWYWLYIHKLCLISTTDYQIAPLHVKISLHTFKYGYGTIEINPSCNLQQLVSSKVFYSTHCLSFYRVTLFLLTHIIRWGNPSTGQLVSIKPKYRNASFLHNSNNSTCDMNRKTVNFHLYLIWVRTYQKLSLRRHIPAMANPISAIKQTIKERGRPPAR